jgi:uncharacterized protein
MNEVRRRTVVLAGLGLLGVACAAPDEQPLVIASGEAGGFYAEFGELLAARLRESDRPSSVVATAGSVDNVRLVASGRAALGIALADIVTAVRAGTRPFTRPVPLLAIGRVYENYLQLVVRADDPARTLADLVGRVVSLGNTGSGAAVVGDRLFAAAGVATDVTRLSLTAATTALAEHRIDALLWSGGLPTPAIADRAASRPVRLLPLADQLPVLRARYGPLYTRSVVPEGVYGSTAPVATIGAANLLVAPSRLPDAVAGDVVRVLADAAARLVPSSAVGTQYLDQPSLVLTGAVPLHPGAVTAYRDLHG